MNPGRALLGPLVLLSWAVYAQAPPAQAPGGAALSWEALSRAKVGAWAEYSLKVGSKEASTIRYALVDKRADRLAIEIETAVPALVMRMDFLPSSAAAWKLARIRMRMGTGAVEEVPPPEGADEIIRKEGGFGKPLGQETVETPIGRFACRRYQQTSMQGPGELWMSDQALPTGLVKTTVSSLGATIALQAMGSGATARIK